MLADKEKGEIRDLVKKHYFKCERSSLKNRIHAELSKRWIDYALEDKYAKLLIPMPENGYHAAPATSHRL